MTNEDLPSSIKIDWVETTEEPFVPKTGTTIFAELTPIEREENTYYTPEYVDWYKETGPVYIPKYEAVPEFEGVQKELIINVETTRVKPWEGQILCIGVLDPNQLEPQALNFIEENEEATVNAFLDWFATTRYSTLIGYNVSFDYRFIYASLQKYRKTVPRWTELELYDCMQQQKQVKSAYVYGNNPTGKLEDWATLLLGAQPYAKQEKVWEWAEEGNIEEIMNFNSDKLVKTYYLWVLDKVVKGTIESQPTTQQTPTLGGGTNQTALGDSEIIKEQTIKVQCPNCMQVQDMTKSAKVIRCSVCGTPISNPAL